MLKKGVIYVCFISLLCGCSIIAPKKISAKEILIQAAMDSDDWDSFHEIADKNIKWQDGTTGSIHSDNYRVYTSDAIFTLEYEDIYGENNYVRISRDIKTEHLEMSGVPSSGSFQDIVVDKVESKSITDNEVAKQKYFVGLFDGWFTNEEVVDAVSFELTKDETGYLITIKPKDIAYYNELLSKMYRKLDPHMNEDFSYDNLKVEVKIENGTIKKMDWTYNQIFDDGIYHTDFITSYSDCDDVNINLDLISNTLQQVKDGKINRDDSVNVGQFLKLK